MSYLIKNPGDFSRIILQGFSTFMEIKNDFPSTVVYILIFVTFVIFGIN